MVGNSVTIAKGGTELGRGIGNDVTFEQPLTADVMDSFTNPLHPLHPFHFTTASNGSTSLTGSVD